MAMPALTDSAIYESTRTTTLTADPAGAFPVKVAADGTVEFPRNALLYADCAYFMSQLRDERGGYVMVEPFHEEWTDLFTTCPRLVLMAPRDHGKSYTVSAYLLWRIWRHNRDPLTGELREGLPDGKWEAVLFSETTEQAGKFFENFQGLLLNNADLFADLLPTFRGARGTVRAVWSRRRIRLMNRAEFAIRAFKTSTRGLHPDLIILDDVLSEKNSLTKYQRDKVWRYFVGTLLPMNPRQMIVIGTALHYDDLLHRLRPKRGRPRKGMVMPPGGVAALRFKWVKYRALNLESREALWPFRHSYNELLAVRAFDPINFAREYQNDPRDDASSIFPMPLLNRATERGADLTFVDRYRRSAEEWVVMGVDFASSETIGADDTVIKIAAVNRATQARRLLWAKILHGEDFTEQITAICDAVVRFGVDVGIVEENGFQKWARTELAKHRETAGRMFGHRTGREKADFDEGVPALKIVLLQGLWTIPCGDEESQEYAALWKAQMNAFGWKDGKLQGVGEHDDAVMATWFVERAIRFIEELLSEPPEEVVHGEDVGIERVRIGDWDQDEIAAMLS